MLFDALCTTLIIIIIIPDIYAAKIKQVASFRRVFSTSPEARRRSEKIKMKRLILLMLAVAGKLLNISFLSFLFASPLFFHNVVFLSSLHFLLRALDIVPLIDMYAR